MFAPLQHLRDHALSHPDEAALITHDQRWSFAQLERTVASVARRLRVDGIAPRQLVATDLEPAVDWIVTLALLSIATRTLSLTGVGPSSGITVDALLTRPGRPVVDAPTVIAIDRLWVEQAIADDAEYDAGASIVLYPRDDSICRVIMTSGTTGSPRAVELSVRAVTHRVAHLHLYWTDARPELNLMSLSTTGGFHTALAALQHGSAYRAVTHATSEMLRAIDIDRVEVLAGSPVQMGRLLADMRESGISLPHLREVRTAGAPVTPTLLEAISRQFDVPVRSVYGSTEGGGLTTRLIRDGDDLADAGSPLPGTHLEIVDDHDQPVSPGVTGTVRYRGAGLATGYSADDELRSFRDGWFYPGDHGSLTAHGHLVLDGRASEIVNVGGVKVDPAAVDAAVNGFPGVVDAASFIIEQVAGAPELGMAVVAGASCDLRALDQLLRQQLPGRHPTVFGQVSVIPRNRMGKVERGRLTEEFRRRLGLD